MSGPLSWWANRKSQHGLRPLAKKPPHLSNGKEWWTTPPTTCPQPEFVEYAAQFMAQLQSQPGSQERNAMMKYVSNWLRTARRILHEESYSPARADLSTTDGLLVGADDAIRSAILACHKAGIRLDQSVIDVHRALQHRTSKIRRERAIEAAKRRQ